MRRRSARLAPIAAFAAFGLLATACGSSTKTTSSDTTVAGGPTTTKEPAIAAATLNGSGSTFVQAFLTDVITGYKNVQPAVTINYGAGGSGKGRTDLQNSLVDFAGTDALVAAADVPTYKGGAFIYVPTVAAPITVSYNLSGVSSLTLDADTIAKIFQRQIKKWNDPAIAALNPSVTNLPSTDITIVHRSDGSGTTQNFTQYLMMASPTVWKLGSGSTVAWDADSSAGSGNAGVVQAVKATAGAIGYIDLSDATAAGGLNFAMVKNSSGMAVGPTLDGAKAAVAATTINADLTYNPLNSSAPTAYPITSPTWIIVYKNQTDKAKGAAIKSFLTYLLGAGQSYASKDNYTPLPPTLAQQATTAVAGIVVPA